MLEQASRSGTQPSDPDANRASYTRSMRLSDKKNIKNLPRILIFYSLYLTISYSYYPLCVLYLVTLEREAVNPRAVHLHLSKLYKRMEYEISVVNYVLLYQGDCSLISYAFYVCVCRVMTYMPRYTHRS